MKIIRNGPRWLKATQSTGPSAEHQRLNALLGRWNTIGMVRTGPAIELTGTDTYEWRPGPLPASPRGRTHGE